MLIFAARLAGSRQLIHGQGECRGRKKNEGMQIPSMIGPPWPCLPSAGQPAGSAEGCGHQRDIALTLLTTCMVRRGCRKGKLVSQKPCPGVPPLCSSQHRQAQGFSPLTPSAHGHTSPAAAPSPGLCSGDHSARVTRPALSFPPAVTPRGHAAGAAHSTAWWHTEPAAPRHWEKSSKEAAGRTASLKPSAIMDVQTWSGRAGQDPAIRWEVMGRAGPAPLSSHSSARSHGHGSGGRGWCS